MIAYLTELEAINRMLSAIRERPVNSLVDDLGEDAGLALRTLREESSSVQTKGYSFNTDLNVPLQIDTQTKKISLTPDTLRVEFDPYDITTDFRPEQRGLLLYNAAKSTYEFDVAVPVKAKAVIRHLPWDLLPQPARQYIALRASRVFTSKYAADPTAVQTAALEEQQALVELSRHYSQTQRPNALNNRWVRQGLRRF